MEQTLTALLEEAIDHRFSDASLLRAALTHPSYASERDPATGDNQRLEFLGDAVLQLVVSSLLFERFPEWGEGELTKLRSALTKESALVSLAQELDLGSFLLLGRGEEQGGGRRRASNLGDGFEALIAAVFLDAGIACVKELCARLLTAYLEDSEALLATENPKGALQELTQRVYQTTPVYEIVRVSGPEHEPQFEVRVLLNGEEIGRAVAGNRRLAEKEAASLALEEVTNHG